MILKIVSVGPGDPSLMNTATVAALRSAGMLFLRTGLHPIVSWLNSLEIPFRTMDDLYESSDDFESLSEATASRLWEYAAAHENTVYAVSDTMTDHTVDAVYSALPLNCRIEIIPGFSFADFYLFTSPAAVNTFQPLMFVFVPPALFPDPVMIHPVLF